MDFLSLSAIEKSNLVADLHAIRDDLLKKAVRKSIREKKPKNIKVKFDNPELERIFHSMPQECQDLRNEMGNMQ